MAKPDIRLGEKLLTLVAAGDENAPDIHVRKEGEGESTLSFNADWANLKVGGGDGSDPEGDIWVRDAGGNRRIQISSGGGRVPDLTQNRVWVDGRTGRIDLGSGPEGTENPDLRLEASTGSLHVGGDLQETPGGGAPAGRVAVHSELQTASEPTAEELRRATELDDGGDGSVVRVGDDSTDGLLSLYWEGSPGTVLGRGILEMGSTGSTGGVELDTRGQGNTIQVRGRHGTFKAETHTGATAAELQSRGRLVVGGENIEGAVMLRHLGDEETKYRVKATEDGLEFQYLVGTSGDFSTAMEIDPTDGTVRVTGGSVESL
jgi:hypothetical protein